VYCDEHIQPPSKFQTYDNILNQTIKEYTILNQAIKEYAINSVFGAVKEAVECNETH
jgi:hypothetical protein